jgi:hypothetical protein
MQRTVYRLSTGEPKAINGWTLEKQAAGLKFLIDEIGKMTDEERNLLPDGLTFEKEYRIKWRDTSDIDRKLDEML